MPQQPLHKLLCVCHIVSYFNGQKWICQLLCLYNLRYDEATQRFALGQQLLVYCGCICSLWSAIILLGYVDPDYWIMDRYKIYVYALPGIYYALLRRSLLQVLNDMLHVHRGLQRTMGLLFCVAVKRAFCWSCLITVELLAIFYWQLSSEEYPQCVFLFVFLICWYWQILLHVNCYIWLQSIYVVMHQAVVAPLNYTQKWIMMNKLLRYQRRLRRIQCDVAYCFSVHILSVLVLISGTFVVNFTMFEPVLEEHGDRVVLLAFEVKQLSYVASLCLLICSLFLVINDFRTERNRFFESLWKTSQPFHKRILDCRKSRRYQSRYEQTLDVIDLLLLSGNRPSDMRPTKVILWEIRMETKVKFNSEMKSFINYLLMLLLLGFLLPLVAISNGFDLSWEMYALENGTTAAYVLSWQERMEIS